MERRCIKSLPSRLPPTATRQLPASLFAEVRGDEMGHREAFTAALIKLNQSSRGEK